tara:strand:+ start:769 stop:1467 length:699 start_codon:yes stop_codon:yes gene_type:complete
MEKQKIKKFFKLFIPPILLDFFRFFKKKIKKDIYNSSPKKQSLDVYYEDKMAHILETWGERNAWIEIQHLLLNKKGKILDIACGTGKIIEVLSKINIKNVYGCDISDFLIQKAIDRGIDKSKLKICDATNLPYEDNFFDYCYSIGSLEHFTEEQIQKFLTSSKRVTKYFGFHQIPMSRLNKDEGWITPYQGYFNNSEEWWNTRCRKVFEKVLILDSGWEDKRSIGKWLILGK